MSQVNSHFCFPFPYAFMSSSSFTFLELLCTLIHVFAVSCVFPRGWDLCWEFLLLFSSLPGWEKCFWVAQRIGEETHDFWVLDGSVFYHMKAINVSGNRIDVRGLFLPILAIRFVAKTVFPQPRILYLTACAYFSLI